MSSCAADVDLGISTIPRIDRCSGRPTQDVDGEGVRPLSAGRSWVPGRYEYRELVPRNPAYATVAGDNAIIFGKVVAVLRRM